MRTADAAGADAVVLIGGADLYNGKAVRASAGSLFHLRIALDAEFADVLDAGLTTLATTGAGDWTSTTSSMTAPAAPTAWLFGSEAHGLPESVLAGGRPHGPHPDPRPGREPQPRGGCRRCLYASARAQRR